MKYIIVLVGRTINSGVNQKNISHSVALSSLTKPKCLKITSIGSPRNYSSKRRQFFFFIPKRILKIGKRSHSLKLCLRTIVEEVSVSGQGQ